MLFECGDVVLVLFPDSNLRTGKRRPALVLMANVPTELPQTIVAMITSNLARAGHPSRIKIEKLSPAGSAMGLLSDSVVMTDNIATVMHAEVDRVIGRCPDMQQIKVALRYTFGL